MYCVDVFFLLLLERESSTIFKLVLGVVLKNRQKNKSWEHRQGVHKQKDNSAYHRAKTEEKREGLHP